MSAKSTVLLWSMLFMSCLKSLGLIQYYKNFPLILSRSFVVLAVIFESLIHFNCYIWCKIKDCVFFFAYRCTIVQLFQHHLFKRLPFSHWGNLACVLKLLGRILCVYFCTLFSFILQCLFLCQHQIVLITIGNYFDFMLLIIFPHFSIRWLALCIFLLMCGVFF